MWGKNIYVIIIPSFLAITFIGQSKYLHLINGFQLSPLLATWVASEVPVYIVPGYVSILTTAWSNTTTLTALAATMAVNTLVTGLIVFKIFRVFLEVRQALGSFSSAAGRPNYQHVAFIIIESGMALFAAHLVRIVLSCLLEMNLSPSIGFLLAYDLAIIFHQMLNVIIISVHSYSFVLLITFTCRASHQQSFWCGSQWDCPSMTKIPSRKVSEV